MTLLYPGHLTRRRMIGGSAALAAGLALGRAGAQTPVASPAAGYAHPDALIDLDWLTSRLPGDDALLVGLMPEAAFEAAHVPASFQVDWPQLEVVDTSDAGIASWEPTIREIVGDLRIEPGQQVVVYDDGTLFAARLWWLLRYLGHEDVRVLNGGLPAWQAASLDVETGPVMTTLEKRPPYTGASNPAILAQSDEVLATFDDPDVVIVDARSPKEYAEGHIPGAVNVNYLLNAAGEPLLWKSADALRQLYSSAGVTPDRLVIPYCSSGVRSAVTVFTLWLLGYPRVALFTGSWNEWRDLPEAPVVTGDQQRA